MKKQFLWITVDFLIAAIIMCMVWIIFYCRAESSEGSQQMTNMALDSEDWHNKFADKFTENIVETDHSYTSPDLLLMCYKEVIDCLLYTSRCV